MFRYIPNWQNKGLTCHFCKTTKSVKYATNIGGAVVPACNKCILTHVTKAEQSEIRSLERKEND